MNHMNIREAENKLFEEWRKKYAHHSFVIDGCPNPDVYLREDRKVVLVLKDGNIGEPEPNDTLDDRTYDQRHELEKAPTLWWNTIAKWCYCLKNTLDTWEHVDNAINDEDSIRTVLSHYCIVQLKKTWGGGSVKNETLSNVVLNDKSEIIRQLSIYEPNFIIACGNGEHLSVVFECKNQKPLTTSTGVRFWNIKLENKDSVLVDYCHPSIRVGTKVKGVVAMGLSTAIQEIEQNS